MQKYTLLYIFVSLFFCAPVVCAKHIIPDSLQMLHFEVDGVSFSMKRVEGGVFLMGGTREQHRERISTDLPTHTVALDAYYIAPTEVTQALWKAIMPEWEFIEEMYLPNFPICYISWNDCQEFVRRLDSITGMPFRLPTEAEWEFAARGGNKSQGFRFAGGNIVDSISWGLSNASFRTHEVKQKQPNELGLYDMTGNVSEWCSDWYGRYHLGTEPNPKGPENGEWKVIRGGSFDNGEANQYISRREYLDPNEATNYCGLRLALTLPDEPTLQVEEPIMVKKLRLKSNQVKLVYVASENPYYISQEPVTWRVWDKVMQVEKTEKWSESVIGKTTDEWNQWLERCRKICNQPIDFASATEVATAIEQGVTYEPSVKQQKQKYWQRNTRSIQRHRKTTKNAQKWADLIGVKLKETDDPTLLIYTDNANKSHPRWIVIR